jgi:hypothetical protein
MPNRRLLKSPLFTGTLLVIGLTGVVYAFSRTAIYRPLSAAKALKAEVRTFGGFVRELGMSEDQFLDYHAFLASGGDPVLAQGLTLEYRLLSQAFVATPDFLLYSETDGPNAFATPLARSRSRFPDGSVCFGTALMQNELAKSRSGVGFSVAAIMAHEFAHIVQYKKRFSQGPRAMELQADYMAGAYMAARRELLLTDFREAADTFAGLGNTDPTDPHGSRKQRVAALMAGYEERRAGFKSLNTMYLKGIEYVTEALNLDDE